MKYMFSGAVSFDADLGRWDVAGDILGMFNKAKAFNAKFGKDFKFPIPIEKEICRALVRLGKATDRETISKYYYVKPKDTLYVMPDQVRIAAREYIEMGGDGFRMALLHTKRSIDELKKNGNPYWEEFRLSVLGEVVRKKEDCDIDNFDTGREYTEFKAQFQINLACAERYLISVVVPQWRNYPSAESAMFPNVFHSPEHTWDADRNIPYRLHPFLESVARPIDHAPNWYKREKDEYVTYMEKVEQHIRTLLRDKLENSQWGSRV